MTNEDKAIELRIEIPGDMSWEEVKELEDELSFQCGEVLKKYDLQRLSHTRRVEADYSAYRENPSDAETEET